jgi:site-specific DNA-methyltransferase (adenine-specific)
MDMGKVGADLIYADCIYESLDFNWVYNYYDLLKPNGILMIQTDYHSVAEWKCFLDSNISMDLHYVNWVIYKQEWGGVPKKGFPQKHDDILIYSKMGTDFYWDATNIQIPKATAGTAFDKKGTGLKTPCSVFDDLGNFSTMSGERVKKDGYNIQWQKPLKLMDRLLAPFTKESDIIIDPFMGSGTTGEWCKLNNRNFAGVENDKDVFDIAKRRISGNE